MNAHNGVAGALWILGGLLMLFPLVRQWWPALTGSAEELRALPTRDWFLVRDRVKQAHAVEVATVFWFSAAAIRWHRGGEVAALLIGGLVFGLLAGGVIAIRTHPAGRWRLLPHCAGYAIVAGEAAQTHPRGLVETVGATVAVVAVAYLYARLLKRRGGPPRPARGA